MSSWNALTKYALWATLLSVSALVGLTNPALATEVQVTTGGGNELRPSFAPGGDFIVFDTNLTGAQDLYVVPTTGGATTRITFDPLLDRHADWSPDSTQFVYSSRNGARPQPDILLIPSGGGTVTTLYADSTTANRFPVWSPDGTMVAFDDGNDIFVIASTGGAATQVTTDPGVDAHPTWSPDGLTLAFVSNRSGNNDIWTIPATGGTATQITTNTANDGAPDWSTDGTTIAFQSNRVGGNQIWTIPSTGGSATQITSGTASVQPDWNDTDTRIAFARAGDIWYYEFPNADLSVTKTVDNATPNEGDTVVFTVALSNAGPDSATTVEVTDLLPAGLTFVSSTQTQGTYNDVTGLWSVGTMLNAGTDTLTITATVDAGTATTLITNTASITNLDEIDPVSGNDSDFADLTVRGVDLGVTKNVDNATPNEGDTINYEVIVGNSGPDTATGVELTDVLPTGVTFVSSSATQGTYNDGTGVWTVGSIAASAADTLTITVTVDAGTAGTSINNTASVSAVNEADTNPGNDSDSASITVQSVDIAVTKNVDNATPNEGATINYTIVATNGGPDGATGVELTDVLPAGVTFVSSNATQGTYNDGTGVWTVGSIAASAADTLTITVTVDAGTAGTSINNTASLTAVDQTDANAANDSDSASITVQSVDIAVTKNVDNATPNEGATINYTVIAANGGPDGATGVELTDVLPAGVTFVSSSATQGTYNDGTGVWTVGSIAASAADTLTITATVDAGTAGTSINNTASLTAVDQTDANAANDSDSAISITVQSVDIAVTKNVDNATPNEGATINYNIVAANGGPDGATGVELTDVLPAGVTFVSSSATQGTYNDGTGVWTVGSIAASAADTLTITATVDAGTAGTSINNTASLTAVDQTDANAANDSDSASITVQSVDIAVTKNVDNATPNEGATINYTVVAANGGPDGATGVELTDVLPAGVTFVSSSATQGTYNDGTGVWTVGSIAASAADTLTITATVDAGTAGTSINNTASLTAVDQTDANAANDSDSASITVQSVDIAVTKNVDNATPNEGATINYTIVAANGGPDGATGVELTDVLPAGVTFVSSSATQGTYNDGTGVWTVGSIAASAADTLTITATVDAGTAGTSINNTASLTAVDQTDANAANDSDSASITVQSVDIAVTKDVDNATPNEGATINYTIVATNGGPDGATGVELTDVLPAGVTFVSSSATQGTYNDGTGVWTVGSIAASAADTLTITATVDAGTAGTSINNTASLTAVDQTDANAANDSDSASITVQSVDIAVTKNVDNATPNEGATINYNIVAANGGPDGATGVELTDVLPAGVTFVSSSATQGTYNDGTGVWTVGSIAASAADTLTITATVDAGTAGTTINNTASLTAVVPNDVNAANDSDSASITVQAVDIAVTKNVDNAAPNEGATINYTVIAANGGPDGATGVELTDLLPAGVTFVSSSATQGTYNDGTGVWTVGSIAASAADTLTITATVDAGTAGQSIINTASLTAVDQTDVNGTNDSDSATIIVQAVDIAVTKNVDNATPDEGATINYTVVAANIGAGGATGVQLTDVLPAGVTFVSSSATQGTYNDGTGVWTVGSIAASAADTLTITATVDAGTAGTTINNTASLTAVDQTDANAANDSDSASITVRSVDIAVTKNVDNATPNEGATINYTVVAANGGPDGATGVELTDVLPAGVTFVSSSATQGTYNDGTGVWTVGSIAASAADTLTITVTVDAGTAGTSINNIASLTVVSPTDVNAANDSDSASITVQSVDIAVTKNVDNATPNEGATINYTIVAANGGPDGATGVELTDVLPAGVTFVSSTATQGTYNDGTGVWTVGSIAASAADTLTITVTVDAGTAGTSINNTASLTAVDQTDANAANDSDSASITVQSVDIAVTKNVDNATPNEGATINYTVVAANGGPDGATGVELTDVLPAGVTFVSSSATQGTYNDGTGVWTVGSIAGGAADTLTITVTVDAGTAGTSINNTASLTAVDQTDANAANDSDSASITVQSVDIAVTKNVDNATPNEGATVNYTVVAANGGPDGATGVELTDVLPAGVTFVSSSATQGTYNDGTGVWTVGAIAGGAADTLTITVTVDAGTAGTSINNTASLTAVDQTDANAANDSDSASITVQSVDIAVTKNVDNATPNEGATINYTVVAANGGPDGATGVELTDVLPAGVTFVSSSATQGTYNDGTGVWTVGAIAGGAADTLTITVTVDAGTAGTSINNTASLTAVDQTDANAANDSDSASITVQSVDIAVTKNVDDATPNEGATINYTVIAANGGPDGATGVELTDVLPAGVTFVSSTATQGTYNDGTGVWTVGSIAGGAADTLTITVTVDAGTAGTSINNTASLTAVDQTDANAANDSDSASITVQSVDIAVTKNVDNATPNEGATINYTVVAANGGPDGATGVELTDVLPAGVTFVSSSATQGTYNDGTGVWTVGAIAGGAADTLTITVTVDAGTAGTSINNTASLTAVDQTDANAANDSDSASITVQSVDIAVTKNVDDATPNEGATINYTVVAANGGPDGATGVELTDVLPAGVTFVSSSATQGTYNDGTGVWTVGAIAGGAADTLTITVTVDAGTAGTSINNTASLTAVDQTDANAANDSDSASITVQSVDIAVTKNVDNATPNEGATINYTVVAANGGPDGATAVELTDVLPAGVTFVSSSATQGTYNDGTGVWTVGAIAGGAADTLTITVTVDAGTAGTSINNTASLTAVDQTDANAANDSDSASITVQSVDIAVTKNVDNATPNEGATINYTVVAANGGPDGATGVELTDVLPAGVTFVSSTATQGTYNDGTGVWTVGAIAGGAADTLTITVTVDAGTAGTSINNTASLTAVDQTDANAANDSDSASITVQSVDIAVTKNVDDATPNEGATINYTIVAANGGPDGATGVELTDVLPAGVTFVSSSATQGTYNDGTGVWTVGSIAGGAADTLTITVTVDAGTAGTSINNTASLTAVDQTDANAANDSDSASITVQSVDIAVTKNVDNATPNEGATINYTIVAANGGPDGATGVELTDVLPAGVTFVSSTATQGTYNDGTGVWTVGAIAASAADTLTITVTVDAGTAGTSINNTASLTAVDQTDANAANDSDSASITVQSVDIAVTKNVDNATPNEGATINYTIVAANVGSDPATGVELTDVLPAGVTFVSSSATQGTYNDGTGVWTVGAIAGSAADTLTITVTVDAGTAGTTVNNTASLTALDQTDVNAANDSDSAAFSVPAVDIAISKTVDDPTPNEGETINYAVVATNAGPDGATGVEVTDLLPAGVTFVSSSATQGTYNDGTGVWTVGSIAASAADTLTITATVDAGTQGTTINNTASLTAVDQTDVNAANDSDSASITMQVADITVTKNAGAPEPNEGEAVNFTILAFNAGPDSATGLAITDVLPAGLTFDSSVQSQGTYNDVTGVWDVGTVAPSTVATLTLVATVDAGTAGTTIVNTASLTALDQADPLAVNDSDSASVTIASIDVAITKTVDLPAPSEGATINYTLIAANAGPSTATGVEVTDNLPAGVTFVSSSATQGSYNDGTGVWTVGSIAASSADTLTITATVDLGTFGQTITNTATLTASTQVDVNATNDSDDAALTVSGSASPTISSLVNRTFFVTDPSSPVSPITVMDAGSPVITAANDIRIRIPAALNMIWDTTDTIALLSGPAAPKVSTSVTYEDGNKTLVLDVTANFTGGETLMIGGLNFTNFTSASPASNLELEVDNAGTVAALDDKTITIVPLVTEVATHSGAIDVSPSGAEVWVVNPDHASVSVLDAGTNSLLAEVPVGREPWTLDYHPTNDEVWVGSLLDDHVYIIDGPSRTVIDSIPAGYETYGVAFNPAGTKALVTASGSNEIFLIDVTTRGIDDTIAPLGDRPRAIAWRADGDRAWVSHLLAPGPFGRITQIFPGSGTTSLIAIQALVDPDLGGYPTTMQNMSVAPAPGDTLLWVPTSLSNTNAGQIAGNAFDDSTTIHSIVRPVSISTFGIDRPSDSYFLSESGTDVGGPIAVAFECGKAFVANLHSNNVTVLSDDILTATELGTIPVGNGPIGIVSQRASNRAYVANWLSRDVTVIDTENDVVLATIPTTTSEPLAAQILNGKQLFYTSTGAMSASGRVACASCHVGGGNDGRTWDHSQYGTFLRNTPDLRGIGFTGPHNWTANQDEMADHHFDIVNFAGGTGFIGSPNPPLGAPNDGLSQDMDDIGRYLASLTQRTDTPFWVGGTQTADADSGQAIFNDPTVGCVDCHTGPFFTDSSLLEAPFLKHDVGTADSLDTDAAAGFDTPSLVGVWATAPYLHDGRAQTLEEVLTTYNPNDMHGTTSQLTPQQIGWLVTYLQSIAWPDSSGTPTDAPDIASSLFRSGIQNVYPNPFASETTFRFSIEHNASQVQIEIYNIEGRRVRTLLDRRMTRGEHIVGWDARNDQGRNVAPGFYFARLIVQGEAAGSRKMTILR